MRKSHNSQKNKSNRQRDKLVDMDSLLISDLIEQKMLTVQGYKHIGQNPFNVLCKQKNSFEISWPIFICEI